MSAKEIVFTEEKKREVIRLYVEEGKGGEAIGRLFGTSCYIILKLLRRSNITIRKDTRIDLDFDEELISKPSSPS